MITRRNFVVVSVLVAACAPACAALADPAAKAFLEKIYAAYKGTWDGNDTLRGIFVKQ
jgi:hypothetical protein